MNTEQKHTPGPWRVGDGSFVIGNHPAPGITGSDDVHHYGGHLICESVSQANARLIAAAPDLLEALKATWKILDAAGLTNLATGVQTGSIAWYCKASDAEQQSRAAIAKAEGKA